MFPCKLNDTPFLLIEKLNVYEGTSRLLVQEAGPGFHCVLTQGNIKGITVIWNFCLHFALFSFFKLFFTTRGGGDMVGLSH